MDKREHGHNLWTEDSLNAPNIRILLPYPEGKGSEDTGIEQGGREAAKKLVLRKFVLLLFPSNFQLDYMDVT